MVTHAVCMCPERLRGRREGVVCGVGWVRVCLRSQHNGRCGPGRPADRRTLGFFFFAGLSLCFFFFGSLSLSSAPLELQPHAAHRIADSDLPSSDPPLLARHIAPAHGHGSGARLRTSSCSSCDAASPSTPWLSASVRPTHMQLPPARTRIKPRRRAPQRHAPLHRAALYPPA